MKHLLFATTLAILFSTTSYASSWLDDESYYQVSVPRGKYAPSDDDSGYQTTKKYRPTQPSASAFQPGSNNLALEMGQTFLMGSNLGKYENALGYQAHYTYGVSEMFAFDSSFGFSNHSNGELGMVSLLGGVRMNLASYDRIIPYLNAGLGFYRPSIEISPNNSVSDTLFGMHFGGGANLLITKQTFFGAELNYHNIFSSTKDTSLGPVSMGGAYLNFMLQAGYTF